MSPLASSKPINKIKEGSITDIEGNIYKTVRIGKQWWMAENLKTTKYNNGTDISNVIVGSEWIELTSGAYCWYGNDISNKAIYGALYNWYAAGAGKLCPKGWHVPSDTELTTLIDFVGGENIAGTMLKATNWGGTDDFGFTALPSGYREFDGSFLNIGIYSYLWSSTEFSSTNAYERLVSYFSNYIYSGTGRKQSGFSVRCIKDY